MTTLDYDSIQSTSQIRIALVVHGMATGGIERNIAHLCNHLTVDRFQPEVFSLTQRGTAADWIHRKSVPIVEFNKPKRNSVYVIGKLARQFRRRRIDIVHSHNWGTLLEVSLARRLARIPLHIHSERGTVLNTIAFGKVRHRLRAKAMLWALRRADAVVSNARSVARRVETRCGYPASQIQLIPNGVMTPEVVCRDSARARLRTELGIPSEAFVVGAVGRLVSVKDYGTALRAIARVGNQRIRLLLVGDGPEKESLMALTRQLGISERVRFAGYHENVGNCLSAMELCINTSVSEGMSQSILEAMSFGLPQIVTDVGDSAELVSAPLQCGIVIPSANDRELASAIEQISEDRNLRSQLSRNAISKHQHEYNFEQMIRQYESLYTAAWKSTFPGMR